MLVAFPGLGAVGACAPEVCSHGGLGGGLGRGDGLHGDHVAAQLAADDFHRVAADGLVHGDELAVVDTRLARLVELGADDINVDLGHEVLQQRLAGLVIQVAPVLSSVADHRVHLVQLAARNRVGDQRRLVQRLVVRGLGLHADGDHGFKGELDARLDHGNHEQSIIEVLLLRNVHRAGGRLLEARLGRLRAPLVQVDVVGVPVGHHGARKVARNNVVLVLLVQRAHDLLQLGGQLKGLDLGRVVQAVHHAGDAAVL
mmetsp:Transcript_4/g.18  ORF Transcript_4/g.18 Transcript_4/m.18 type:complete len:257 (+) Transcript_4:80-850(+)